jgi:ABC-type Mn2+/Zn2+ transport system ATPase subunit
MVLGTNGTGKSTIMRTILQKCNAKKALVVTNHIEEWRDVPEVNLSHREDFIFEGIRKTRCYQPTKGDMGTLAKLRYFRKGIIIFDDARLYMKDAKTDNLIEDLMISYRQQELDIFVVAHGFTKVRPVFYSYVSNIILFRTLDSVQYRKMELGENYRRIVDAQAEVNRNAMKDPHYYKWIKLW